MGHTRLGPIPKTRKWKNVVNIILSENLPRISTDIDKIADLAIHASEIALNQALNDMGLRYTFYLLTQIALSAREDNWMEAIQPFNIQLDKNAGTFDLVVELQASIDNFLSSRNHTDISEMAQQAAGEAIMQLCMPKANTLFGSGRDELQLAVKGLSTRKGFSDLSQHFFGSFIKRFLNFNLSRVTATYLGSTRIPSIAEIHEFNNQLSLHCFQSARIVRDFCGEWYSKTQYKEGIDLANSSRALVTAIKKIQRELKHQEEEN